MSWTTEAVDELHLRQLDAAIGLLVRSEADDAAAVKLFTARSRPANVDSVEA